MIDTKFIANITRVTASWLNGVNDYIVGLAQSTGSSLVGFIQNGVGAASRTVQTKLTDETSVFDFMTPTQIADVRAGTALLDVTDACQNALNASKYVVFPHPGKYKLSRPLVPQPGATIVGGGKSPVYPYDSGTYSGQFGTELVVINFAAFNLTGLTGVKLRGFGIKAVGGGISAYGAPASYVAGAMGALITGSTLCEITDVSFHGLEYGVAASPTTNGAEAAFWKLDDFTAQDCSTVVKVGNATTAATVARDFVVSGCVIALHCNQMIDVNWGDGARLELLRFFQAYGVSVSIKNTPFVTMSGVTCFESKGNNIVLDTCNYPVLSGVTSSRAGGYSATTPWPSARGISLLNCVGAQVEGVIEHPSEIALYLNGSSNVAAQVTVVEPFFTNGMLSPGSLQGAITVINSSNVVAHGSASGNSYLYTVASDYTSAQSLSGKISGDAFGGVYRGYSLVAGDATFVHELGADLPIGAAGTSTVTTRRVWVPAGKSLVSRSFHMTSPGVTLRIGANFWTGALTAETDGGNTSTEKKTIFTNSGAGQYYSVVVQLYNPTASTVTVPAGHKTMVSFALE